MDESFLPADDENLTRRHQNEQSLTSSDALTN